MICYEINSPQIQLRCCYANALHWYGYLQQMASMHVDQVISLARAETLPADAPSVGHSIRNLSLMFPAVVWII
jgi:hypothetical protein